MSSLRRTWKTPNQPKTQAISCLLGSFCHQKKHGPTGAEWADLGSPEERSPVPLGLQGSCAEQVTLLTTKHITPGREVGNRKFKPLLREPEWHDPKQSTKPFNGSKPSFSMAARPEDLKLKLFVLIWKFLAGHKSRKNGIINHHYF